MNAPNQNVQKALPSDWQNMDAAEKDIYSQTSLSRTHLFGITAYLEVKIWSLF